MYALPVCEMEVFHGDTQQKNKFVRRFYTFKQWDSFVDSDILTNGNELS